MQHFVLSIFTAPAFTATIIPLEPCALNAAFRTEFQHLIKSPYFTDTTKREVSG
jgi:hypothetical protein